MIKLYNKTFFFKKNNLKRLHFSFFLFVLFISSNFLSGCAQFLSGNSEDSSPIIEIESQPNLPYQAICTRKSRIPTTYYRDYLLNIKPHMKSGSSTANIYNACFLIANLGALRITSTFHSCESPNDLINKPTGSSGSDNKEHVCFDREYVDQTRRIFNYLADCFNLNKNRLFKLFAHESNLTLNISSTTGSKCHGQVSGIAVHDMGYTIPSHLLETAKNTRWKQYGSEGFKPFPKYRYEDVYKEALERCRDIEKIKKITVSEKQDGNIDINLTCGLTRNPETCLFYSILYFKRINKETLEYTLDATNPDVSSYFSSINSSEKERTDFLWKVSYLQYNAGPKIIGFMNGDANEENEKKSEYKFSNLNVNNSNTAKESADNFFEEFKEYAISKATDTEKQSEIRAYVPKVLKSLDTGDAGHFGIPPIKQSLSIIHPHYSDAELTSEANQLRDHCNIESMSF